MVGAFNKFVVLLRKKSDSSHHKSKNGHVVSNKECNSLNHLNLLSSESDKPPLKSPRSRNRRWNSFHSHNQNSIKDQNRVISNGNVREPLVIKSNVKAQEQTPATASVVTTTRKYSRSNDSKQCCLNCSTTNQLTSQLVHTSKGMEAFAVLLQYLTKDPDVYCLPNIKNEMLDYKNQWLKAREELDKKSNNYEELESNFASEKSAYEQKFQDMRNVYLEQLAELNDKHSGQIQEYEINYNEKLVNVENRFHNQEIELCRQFRRELETIELKAENKLDSILNDALHQVNLIKKEYVTFQEKMKEEFEKRSDEIQFQFSGKEDILLSQLNESRHRYECQVKELEMELMEKENEINKCSLAKEIELSRRKREHDVLCKRDQYDGETKTQVGARQQFHELEDEVWSLRSVLDLKHTEIQELRKQNEKLHHDARDLPFISQKLQSSLARIEDLEAQLKTKTESEKNLLRENRRLLELLQSENDKRKRTQFQNEELMWKLKQNTEVSKALAAKTASRHNSSSSAQGHNSCSDISDKDDSDLQTVRINSTKSRRENIDSGIRRSLTDNNLKFVELPTDTSQKVLGVVEKTDSVSWVLEIDEPPIEVASRMLRRANSLRGTPLKYNNSSNSHTLPTRSKKHRRPAVISSTTVDANMNSQLSKTDSCSSYETIQESENKNLITNNVGQSNVELSTNQIVKYKTSDEDAPNISEIFDFLHDSDNEDITDASDVQESYYNSDNCISYSESGSNSENSLEMDDYARLSNVPYKNFICEANTSVSEEECNLGSPSSPVLPKIGAGEAMVSKETSDIEITSDDSIVDADEGINMGRIMFEQCNRTRK